MTQDVSAPRSSRFPYALLVLCALYGLTSLWTLDRASLAPSALLLALAIFATTVVFFNGFRAGPAISTTAGLAVAAGVLLLPHLAPRAWLHVKGSYTTFTDEGAPVEQSVDYRPSVFELVAADRTPLPSLLGLPAPVTLLVIALVLTGLAMACRKVPLAVLAVVAQGGALVLAMRMRSSIAWLPADARSAIQYIEPLSGPSVVVNAAAFGLVVSLSIAYRVFVLTMPEREAARKDGRPGALELLGAVRQLRALPADKPASRPV